MARHDSMFDTGEIVYLVTDPEQYPRMVTEVRFDVNGSCLYQLSQSTNISIHFEKEITRDKNIDIVLGINSN